MYAVIRTGGKQYRVQEGAVLRVEKLDADEGSTVEFNEVLLLGKDGKVEVGSPTVSNAKVTAAVRRHGKGRKISVIKFKRRKNYLRNKGHRQQYTEVRIEKINPGKRAAAAKATKAKAEPAEALAEA